MPPTKRVAGQPVSPALRRKIVKMLRDGVSQDRTRVECGVSQRTVSNIRREEGIEPRKAGRNDQHYPDDVIDEILRRLKEPDRDSDAMIAESMNISSSVVKRVRRKHKIGKWEYPPPKEPAKLDSTPETRKQIGLIDENRRLRGELRKMQRQHLDDDAIKILLGRIRAEEPDPPKWLGKPRGKQPSPKPEVPITIWADWHMGEVVNLEETAGVNEYNPEIAERRIKNVVLSTIEICRDYHQPKNYPGVVVNLLGDLISGAIHPELAKTDAEEQIPSALRCRDILVWALDEMIEFFGQVYVPCVCGNHGRNTLKPEYKRYVYHSFDWLIYQLLARHYEGRKEIVFDIRPSNEVFYKVFSQRYFAMHGDMMGVRGGDGIIGALGPIARGEVKVGKLAAAIGQDYDRLLIGHWHQEITLPRVVVANSLKGWDEYAKNALRAPPSTPSQPLWFVHSKRPQTSYWNVFAEDSPTYDKTEWIGFPKTENV